MGNEDWPQRLSCALERFVDKSQVQQIMDGSDKLAEMDEKAKAKWVVKAMDKIDQRINDHDTKVEIMTECSCRCYEEFLEEFKSEYQQNRDIDKLIEVMHGKVFLNKPVREGDVIYVTKAPRFPEKHAKAKSAEEKKYYFCHCDYARAVETDISPTYCLCGAGWCKRIWEQVLQRKVRVEIAQSVLLGDDVCQFAVYL